MNNGKESVKISRASNMSLCIFTSRVATYHFSNHMETCDCDARCELDLESLNDIDSCCIIRDSSNMN